MDDSELIAATSMSPLHSTEGLTAGDVVAIAGVASARECATAPTTLRDAIGYRLSVQRQPGPMTRIAAQWELVDDTSFVVPFEIDVGQWPVRVEPSSNSAVVVARPSHYEYGRTSQAPPAFAKQVLELLDREPRLVRGRLRWTVTAIPPRTWVFVVGRVQFGAEIPGGSDVYRGALRRQVVLQTPPSFPLIVSDRFGARLARALRRQPEQAGAWRQHMLDRRA